MASGAYERLIVETVGRDARPRLGRLDLRPTQAGSLYKPGDILKIEATAGRVEDAVIRYVWLEDWLEPMPRRARWERVLWRLGLTRLVRHNDAIRSRELLAYLGTIR